MLNKIALGTAQFGFNYGITGGQQVDQNEVRKILKWGRQHGIKVLDTAMGYGDSERVLGQIGVQDFRVISKLPVIPKGCRSVEDWVIKLVQKSLKQLKLKKLYGLLLHRPEELSGENGDSLNKALKEVHAKGLVGKLGVSIYDPEELERLPDDFILQIVQAPFNALDQRLFQSGWLERLYNQGIEIHVRSLFLQGLLIMNKMQRPKKFERWRYLWDRWDEWLQKEQLSPIQACLWPMSDYLQIDRLIIGVENLQQLQQISACLENHQSISIPYYLNCTDRDLINPSRWNQL